MRYAAAAARAQSAIFRTFGVPATIDGAPCTVVLSRATETGPAGYDTRVSGQSVTALVRVGIETGMLPTAPAAGALLVAGDESWRVLQPPERTGEAGEYRLVLT